MSQEETKEAMKEALKEWLDERYADFGKKVLWSVMTVVFTAVIYFVLTTNGWHK